MEQVPSLPILSGQDTVERRGVAEATRQTVGQLLATGATGVADWLWPQGEPSSTRVTYGEWVPATQQEAGGADSGA